ncbi:MAG: ATP synthase F0 subunit B [Endomicrobium sp.]|jgi:F-type H+-transporting ATPase subunit b|nr:ATP synthase F0 subunit B [Endomicrobium sp.]
MEIIQKFGFDIKLFFFQIINFVIIAFIIKKFLYIPLKKILDERKYKIEQSIIEKNNAKVILQNAENIRKKILVEAKKKADIIVEESKISIAHEKQKAISEAKHQSEQILLDAKEKATNEFKILNNQIQNMSIDISKKIILKVLSDLFDDNEKQKLISKALKKINEKINN